MQKHALVLTTFAFILAVGAMAASAQQIPDVATTPTTGAGTPATGRPNSGDLEGRGRDGLGLRPRLEAPPDWGRGGMGLA
jgi:hypothetical protein